jgi:hypothetical protein
MATNYKEHSNSAGYTFHAVLFSILFFIFLDLLGMVVSNGPLQFGIAVIIPAVGYTVFGEFVFLSIAENVSELIRDNFPGKITRATGPKLVVLLPWETSGREAKNKFNLDTRTYQVPVEVQANGDLRVEAKAIIQWKVSASGVGTYNALGDDEAGVVAVTTFLEVSVRDYISMKCYGVGTDGKKRLLTGGEIIANEADIRSGFEAYIGSDENRRKLMEKFGAELVFCQIKDVDYSKSSQELLSLRATALLGIDGDIELTERLAAATKGLLGDNANAEDIRATMELGYAASTRATQVSTQALNVNVRGVTPEMVSAVATVAGSPAMSGVVGSVVKAFSGTPVLPAAAGGAPIKGKPNKKKGAK